MVPPILPTTLVCGHVPGPRRTIPSRTTSPSPVRAPRLSLQALLALRRQARYAGSLPRGKAASGRRLVRGLTDPTSIR